MVETINEHTLLERARVEGTPLVDGNTVTLVWKGDKAPALRGDFTQWQHNPALALKPAEPGLWIYQANLPAGAYMEYCFFDGEKRLLDPLNKRLTANGLGKYNNYFYMPGSGITQFARRRPEVPHGILNRVVVEGGKTIAGGRRPVYFYRPPVSGPTPLLLVWDGYDYLRRVRLPVILDNLIADQLIAPLALVMVHHGGQARVEEYSCRPATLDYLQEHVLPVARQELDLVSNAGAHGVLGASMGGLMALYTGFRLPELFGKVYSQSGSFSHAGNDKVIFPLVEQTLSSGTLGPQQVYQEAGQFEYTGLVQANRRMQAVLSRLGSGHFYQEYPAGHNYPAWRDLTPAGLQWLFPPREAG